jgi:hypothetical protein
MPRTSVVRAAPVVGVVAALLGVLTWPLLFTSSGFAGDWGHHLWLMWHQSLSIRSSGLPSLFLDSDYSVFYPTYAFYGGTLYAVGGVLSLVFGEAPVSAYVFIYVMDFVAAFAGWYWLARIVGVDRWLAVVPGLIFVTSAYYITVVYVQGDWPEFTGISMIPLMVAAGLSVLTAGRLRAGAAWALALSTLLFFGAHNITIMLGLTTLAITGVAILACVPEARRRVSGRGVGRVASVAVPAALVSAWYVLPILAYQSKTRIGSNYYETHLGITETAPLVSLGHLFTFSRTYGPGLPAPYYLSLALPVLAIAWVLVGILTLPWRARSRAWVRVLFVCAAVALAIAIVMTHVGLLLALPHPYPQVEFGYRLEAYVLLMLSGVVLVALVLARGNSRWARLWSWMALPVCAVSLVGAIGQIGSYPYPGQDRYAALESFGEVGGGYNADFQTVGRAIAGRGLRVVAIPPEAVHDDRVSFTVRAHPGSLVETNIGAGPYLLHVTGAKAVGVDSQTGLMVLAVDAPRRAAAARSAAAGAATRTASGQATISIRTGNSAPIVLGRLLSLVGLVALALRLLVVPAGRVLVRGRARKVSATTRSAGGRQ